MADDMRMNSAPGMSSGGDMRDSGRGSSKLPWVVLVVVVAVLVILGVLFRDKLFSGKTAGTEKSSGYQSVFLTNGQVYFGKMSGHDDNYATLKDIYYLQVTTPPGLQGSQSQASAAQQAQQQLSLVKLGQELHGPVDSMQINRDQILFFEDMKEDGKVMQAIREYQKNPPANTQGNQAPAAAPQVPAPATNAPVNK
jgi:hypothetical protein